MRRTVEAPQELPGLPGAAAVLGRKAAVPGLIVAAVLGLILVEEGSL